MAEYQIRKASNELIFVLDSDDGKLVHFNINADEGIMDVFSVGISWKSLDKLRERSKRKVFNWEVSDKSLVIDCNSNEWRLHFKMQSPPFKTVNTALLTEEIDKLKKAFFSR